MQPNARRRAESRTLVQPANERPIARSVITLRQRYPRYGTNWCTLKRLPSPDRQARPGLLPNVWWNLFFSASADFSPDCRDISKPFKSFQNVSERSPRWGVLLYGQVPGLLFPVVVEWCPAPQLSLGEVLLVDRAGHRVLRVHDVGDLDHSALAQELVGVHFVVSV